MRRVVVVLVLVSLLVWTAVFAEDVIHTKDGKRFSGKLESFDGKIAVLKTKYGTLKVPASDIEYLVREMWRVKIGKREVLEGELVEENDDVVRLKTSWGGVIEVPRKHIASMETFRKVSTGEGKDVSLTRQEAQRLSREALGLLQQKRYDECIKVYRKVLIVYPDDQIALYNTACAYALKGDRERAADFLKRSVLAGYVDFRHMERDPDLDSIRDHPIYKEIMKNKEKYEYKAATNRLNSLKKRFGEGYLYEVDEEHRFIFATYQSKEILERLKNVLLEYAKAQWNFIFKNKPSYYITIVLPSPADFRKMVGGRGIGGFYNHAGRMLVTPSIGGALIHEFTHALHFADMDARRQQHPIWIVEGLATCFETSEVTDNCAVPKHNHRLTVIQRTIAAGRCIPLDKFVNYSHLQYMGNASVCYAQSRYIMFYLWKHNLLDKFYKLYVEEEYKKDKTGRSALEKVLGKKLEEFQKEWEEWVKGQKVEIKRVAKGGPFMGIGLAAAAGGIQVLRVVPGGPADKAGIKEGDLIISIDGEPVKTRDRLIEILKKHKPGDVIELEVLRRDEKMKIKLELGRRED